MFINKEMETKERILAASPPTVTFSALSTRSLNPVHQKLASNYQMLFSFGSDLWSIAQMQMWVTQLYQL